MSVKLEDLMITDPRRADLEADTRTAAEVIAFRSEGTTSGPPVDVPL